MNNYNQQENFDNDDVTKERSRIINMVSKPCPPDFPPALRPYWSNNLEFSLTPCQTGWMQLDAMKKKR